MKFSIEEKSTGNSEVWGDRQCLLVLFGALLVGGSGWHLVGLKDHKPPGRLLQQVPAVEHASARCLWWTSPNHGRTRGLKGEISSSCSLGKTVALTGSKQNKSLSCLKETCTLSSVLPSLLAAARI